jgi:UDP-MurNAc hydroxylase
MDNVLKYLGHAGFWIRTAEVDFIMDPWFSNKGAYHSGWFQWPPNQSYFKYLLDHLIDSERTCYIYLSHEHEDHFCLETLNSIVNKKNVIFIIPEFENKIFEKTMHNKFFDNDNILVLADNKKTHLENFAVTLFIDDQGINHDSAILFQSDNFSFFNQNDCKIFDVLEKVLKAEKNIDYYACQFSGANWHPSTFIMTEKERKNISQTRNKQKFTNIAESILKLSPKNYIASAGPVCFLDPEENYINLNTYNFPHSNELFKYLKPYFKNNDIKCKLLSPSPGEVIEDKIQNSSLPSSKDIVNYRRQFFHGRPNLQVERKEIILFLNKKLKKIKNYIHSCDFQGPLIFTLKNVNYLIDFERIKIIIIQEVHFPQAYMRIIASDWWFKLMVNNESGQNLCLTMHPRIIRNNKYCVFQNLFLFSNLDDIKIVFEQTLNLNEQRCIVKLNDGCKFEINQFCPHQGADLKNVKIINGILTCPRHNISFDLNQKGNALNGINLTLNAKKI